MATREGLLTLDLDFLNNKEKTETEEDTKGITQKTFPVIEQGAYWEVQVSSCGLFLAALESSDKLIIVDCEKK